LHASREHGLVFKGARTEATISRQIIRQHGIGKLKGAGDNQHFYFIQVGRKSPYGEGTINIFDTPELNRLGKKKNMTGAAFIGEWITNRVYSSRTHPSNDPEPETPPPISPPSKSFPPSMEDGKAGGQKWWEKDEGTTEYEADIDIPLMLQQDNKIVVEDTEDIYSMPARPECSPSTDQSLYYNLDPSPSASPKPTKKKPSKKKNKVISTVMVEDTQDVYALPDQK